MTVKQITSMDWVRLVERAIVFFVVPWAVWATANIYDIVAFHKYGNQFSDDDAVAMELRMGGRIDGIREMLVIFERSFSKEFVRKDEIDRSVLK